jgi:hypothetical protein
MVYLAVKIEIKQQAINIQTSAPDEQRQLTTPGNIVDCCLSMLFKQRCAIAFVWVNNIEQVMRHLIPVGSRWFGSTDVQAPVHRPGIGTDNLAIKLLSQLKSQR